MFPPFGWPGCCCLWIIGPAGMVTTVLGISGWSIISLVSIFQTLFAPIFLYLLQSLSLFATKKRKVPLRMYLATSQWCTTMKFTETFTYKCAGMVHLFATCLLLFGEDLLLPNIKATKQQKIAMHIINSPCHYNQMTHTQLYSTYPLIWIGSSDLQYRTW